MIIRFLKIVEIIAIPVCLLLYAYFKAVDNAPLASFVSWILLVHTLLRLAKMISQRQEAKRQQVEA